jgi:intein/homing endonuclease
LEKIKRVERKEKNKIIKKEILAIKEFGETVKIRKIKESQNKKDKINQRLLEILFWKFFW